MKTDKLRCELRQLEINDRYEKEELRNDYSDKTARVYEEWETDRDELWNDMSTLRQTL